MHEHLVEEDDDDVLAWASAGAARHDDHDGHEDADDVNAGTGVDDDAFVELVYETHGAGPDALLHLPPASSHHEPSAQQQQQQQQQNQKQQQQRVKRRNFSKQLQLLSLQRYALFAREHARAPTSRECQQLLQLSYAQFVADGGAPDEPQLSPSEFLKLIRNRRREMHARAATVAATSTSSSSSSSNSSNGADATPTRKRRLQQEHLRIYELIEAIDEARGRAADLQSSVQRKRQASHASLGLSTGEPPPPTTTSTTATSPVSMNPQDQIRAIFRLQQETLEVQREIAQRLKVIRLHRGLQLEHDDAMEPSSASV